MRNATTLFDLKGKTAIVTGASSGIGCHAAELLALAGAKVAVAARRLDALGDLVGRIVAADGRAIPVHLDVTDPASIKACVETAETELGAVSILVNNAGIAVAKPTLEQEEADWDRVLDTNLKGIWLMAQEVARHMERLGHGGTIINIASILGLAGTQQLAGYCASKGGVISLTKAMAADLARHDIRVNAIAPGYILTEINRDLLESPDSGSLRKRIPQRRFGATEDLDGVLLLLASDASRFMTGSVVVVDGGQSSVV